jgi:hypothetical protein
LRGFDDASLEITLSANRSQDFAIRLVPKSDTGAPPPVAVAPQAAAPPPAEKRDEEPSKGLGIWPWVTLGAGGVALGGALTFELLRRGSENAAEKEDTQIGYQEKLDQMESRQTTARILAGVGGALVIAGGVLVVVDQSSSKSPKAASLAFTPTPGGLFVSARGAY